MGVRFDGRYVRRRDVLSTTDIRRGNGLEDRRLVEIAPVVAPDLHRLSRCSIE